MKYIFKNKIWKMPVCVLLVLSVVLGFGTLAQEDNASIGIIGGADGPTSIYVTDAKGNSKTYTIDKNDDGAAKPELGAESETDGEAPSQNENSNETVNDSVKKEQETEGISADDPFIIRLYGGGILNMIPMGSGAMNVIITIAMYILCALVAYALGSLNFGIIVSKVIYHDDIRNYGSGTAGTTNMLRTYGKGAALATILGDALKVVLAVVIGNCIVGSLFFGGYVAGFFAVLGHVYPIYYKFKGGKGVVASAITMLMLDWRVFLIVLGVFVIVVAVWRYISLGSILSAAVYPMITYAAAIVDGKGAGLDVIFAFILAMFVIVLHRTNIQRLLEGKENKLSFKKKDKKPKQ